MSDKILRFSASWCQPCKMLAKTLEGEDLGVPVEVVDIDENSELAMQFGIRGVPTLVYIKEDKEAGRISGMQTIAALKEWITKL